MYKTERLLPLLRKVEVAVKRIIDKSAEIDSIDYYLTSSAAWNDWKALACCLSPLEKA